MKKKNTMIVLGCVIVCLLFFLLGCSMLQQMYSVTFDTDGGRAVATQSVLENKKATRPSTNPIKTGYTFDNWYTDKAFASAWNFDTPITKDTTLYAKWASDEQTLSFVANRGTGSMEIRRA